MRCEGGSRLNQCIFAFVNVWLVVGWAWQLNEEARQKKEAHIKELKEEIRVWDEEIERLERLFEVSFFGMLVVMGSHGDGDCKDIF